MINILVMVISCDNNKYLWDEILKRDVSNTVIVCGGTLDTDYRLDKNILHVNCRDTYDGLPEKVFCAASAINKIKEYDDITHVLKVDDHDTTFSKLNIARLQKHGESILLNNSFLCQHTFRTCMGSHHIGRCPGSKWNTRLYEGDNCEYAAGGFSYILDRNAIQKIVEKFDTKKLENIREKHIYEDLMVSLILKEHGILPLKTYYGIESSDPLFKNVIPITVRRSFLSLAL